MTKRLLLILAVAFSFTINAQTDEAIGATPIQLSQTYNCENAETGDFQGFTKSDEFTCAGYDNWIDSWYSFTPTETKTYSIEIEALNASSTTSIRIGIYTGTPGNLTSITGCATRYYSNALNSGQTYYINTRGITATTQYRLCVYAFPDPPTNDEPDSATTLLESTFEICENSSIGYTASASYTFESICSTSNPDVWYSFTAPETAEYTFKADLVNGATPLYIGIYTGTPGYLNAIAETTTSPTLQCEDIVLADLTAGNTYYISVTSSQSSQAVYFELCAYKSPPAPSNDDCNNPIALTVGQTFEDNFITATTTSATVNSGNSNFPNCGTLSDFGIYGKDVWFSVVVPASGNFTIETRAESTETYLNDTAMETYTGSCGTSTLIPFYYNIPPPNNGTAYCNNQFEIGGNPFAGISFINKTPGETVIIRVWGWAYQFGKFRISAYDSTSLSVDEFDLNNLSYYPNPVNDVLNIKYNKNIDNITVHDILGKAIIRKETSNQLVSLNLIDIESGIYIVTVQSGNQSTNFKILKK
ncbi:T9SS type A sorting domain-containing protein [Lacinutrix sp. MedPE-SW]|uniref:T9SS type A sorting domain-containing protein n=1 Tax=Lacinutrix sp. MedPE-SW TaxID=1860087 RepID=UPI0009102057|nr:T9SS type A sorting domain-containing protein [Lacinutrix sp. MedPE-SW]OIQ21511.1 MAG: hypothetical protein BM549_08690 [Lacinutrix sp. MedPE-SW]